jgi:hypothetical protein
MDNCFLVSILVMVGFTIGETTVVIAQPNHSNGDMRVLEGLDSDDKRIILKWLETNGTNLTQSDPTPTFTIDKRDFSKAFAQLFETSNE